MTPPPPPPLSPAGRWWIRHSQKDGGGRLTTLFFFFLHLLKICLKTSSNNTLNESIFFVKNPPLPPFLPSPLPPPSPSLLKPNSHQVLSNRNSLWLAALQKKADGRLFNAERRFQFGGGKLECECVRACVCLWVCMCSVCFTGFFKVCGFFIFILVSLFFFFLENQRKSILKRVNFSGWVYLAVTLLDFRTTQTQHEVPTTIYDMQLNYRYIYIYIKKNLCLLF